MEETRAVYGDTVELKITLANESGSTRTITITNPKEDATEESDALAELVLNSDTNILAVNGEQPVSMIVDKILTTRENVGEYGTFKPLYLKPSVVETNGDTGTYTAKAFNYTAEATATVVPENNDITATFATDTGILTVTINTAISETYFVILEDGDNATASLRFV